MQLGSLMPVHDACATHMSIGAIRVLQVCINTAPHMVEPQLDKLLPLLFLKLCAGKQQVRSAAEGALQGVCGLCLEACDCAQAETRSLGPSTQPRFSSIDATVFSVPVSHALQKRLRIQNLYLILCVCSMCPALGC